MALLDVDGTLIDGLTVVLASSSDEGDLEFFVDRLDNHQRLGPRRRRSDLGWRTGLEPATTGTTTRGSTN